MLLREEHLPSRTLGRTPTLHAPLQRAQLTILKTARVLPLQKLEDRLGLKPGVPLKQLLDLVPYLNKRVRPSPSTHRRWQFAWQ